MYLPQQESESIIFKGWFFFWKLPVIFDILDWNEWVGGLMCTWAAAAALLRALQCPCPAPCDAGAAELGNSSSLAHLERSPNTWTGQRLPQVKDKKTKKTLTLKRFKYLLKKSTSSFQHRKGSNLVPAFRISSFPFMFLILVMTDWVQHQGVKGNPGTAHGHPGEVRF